MRTRAAQATLAVAVVGLGFASLAHAQGGVAPSSLWVRAPDWVTEADVGATFDSEFAPLPGAPHPEVRVREVDESATQTLRALGTVEVAANARSWRVVAPGWRGGATLRAAQITRRAALVDRDAPVPGSAEWRLEELAVGWLVEASFLRPRAISQADLGHARSSATSASQLAGRLDATLRVDEVGFAERSGAADLPLETSLRAFASQVPRATPAPVFMRLARVPRGAARLPDGVGAVAPPAVHRLLVRIDAVVRPDGALASEDFAVGVVAPGDLYRTACLGDPTQRARVRLGNERVSFPTAPRTRAAPGSHALLLEVLTDEGLWLAVGDASPERAGRSAAELAAALARPDHLTAVTLERGTTVTLRVDAAAAGP